MDDSTLQSRSMERPCFLNLPAEVRIAILQYVFDDNLSGDGFTNRGKEGGILIDEKYRANDHLQTLLSCRQIYSDGSLLALSRTSFTVSNLFFRVPDRLSLLHSKQIAAVRNIAFVADSRHFRKLIEWGNYPFDMPDLQLDTLTIILHRSSFWHYLFDFTAGITKVLRTLKSVRRFVFVRNDALVKGSFKTWYNRLVGLIMKIDHHERYEKSPPNPEKIWWKWSFGEVAQTICLEAHPPKAVVDEETYLLSMKPLMEELMISIENEEWNPVSIMMSTFLPSALET